MITWTLPAISSSCVQPAPNPEQAALPCIRVHQPWEEGNKTARWRSKGCTQSCQSYLLEAAQPMSSWKEVRQQSRVPPETSGERTAGAALGKCCRGVKTLILHMVRLQHKTCAGPCKSWQSPQSVGQNPSPVHLCTSSGWGVSETLTGVLITTMNRRLLIQGHNCHANGLQYGQCFPPGFGHRILCSFWQMLQFRSQQWGSLKSRISIACLYLEAPLIISSTWNNALWFPYSSSICISGFLCQLWTVFVEENKENFLKTH